MADTAAGGRATAARMAIAAGAAPTGSTTRSIVIVGLWWCWASAVVSLFLFAVYPDLRSAWALAGAQVAAYAVLVAPAVVLRPPLHQRGGTVQRLLWTGAGAVVLVVAIVEVAASQHSGSSVVREVTTRAATGIGEEVLFRGVIWSALARVVTRLAAVLLFDVALFVAWHVPSVLAGDSTWQGLWTVGALGILFALARIVSRRLELPVLLHTAVDLLGS